MNLCPDIENDYSDPLGRFGLFCISFLRALNESHYEPSPNGCYLTINEERLLSTCCQLATCFCIHYNLEEDVGVSIEKLSKFGVNITRKRVEIQPKARNIRLISFLNQVNSIRMNKREHMDVLKTHFYPKYIHDIICALVQVCYSPNSASDFKQRDLFINWLEVDLFDQTDGANLVSNLLTAQSSYSFKHRTNVWFTNAIGRMLTKCLLRPSSVMSVIRAVLTDMNALSTVELASDWKKCDIVARILAQCPREVKINDYVELISPQILNLFYNYDPRHAKHFYRVAGSIYSLFAQKWPQLTQTHLTRKIISNIYPIGDENNQSFELNAQQFRESVNYLNLIFVGCTEPSWSTLSQLPVGLVKVLFEVYNSLRRKVNCHRSKAKIEEILKTYVRLMPNERLLGFLNDLLLTSLIENNNEIVSEYQFMFENYDDEENDSNELIVIRFNGQEETNERVVTIEMVEARCKHLASLVKSLHDAQLDIQFLLFLFDEISKCVSNDSKQESCSTDSKSDSTLLNMERRIERESQQINLKIVYFTQMSVMFEQIDPQLIIDKHERIIKFCHVILENLIRFLKKENNSELLTEQNELLHLILSVVSVFTTGLLEVDYEVKKQLQVLLPYLSDLKELYSESDLAEMCEALRISVATYCGIKTTDLKEEASKNANKPLIEVIDEDISDEPQNNDEYSLAMRDAIDPLVPIRAHGLVTLRKLIEKKNEKCMQNKTRLVDLFVRNLKNNDSYVYLAAIFGLISAVDMDPDRILDTLIDQYMNSENKLDVDNKLKVGEVLTKTVKNSGQLVPKYGPKLINAFLVSTKNENEFLRASALSNLGEVCKLLKFSLSLNIHEIINCLSSYLDTDSSVHVKRSAIMVLRMIIEGLSEENFVAVLGSSIRPLYKLLVRVRASSQDEVISLNCQLASEYVNELMRHSMFPEQKLRKEIKVLRP